MKVQVSGVLRAFPQVTDSTRSLPAEVDEDPPEVLGVLLHPGVQGLDLFLVEEAQHPLLQLPAALARMISTIDALVATASAMTARRARSMSSPRL